MNEEGNNGNSELQALLRQLPSVDRLLLSPAAYDLVERYGRELVVESLRATLDHLRAAIVENWSWNPCAPPWTICARLLFANGDRYR